MDVTERVVREHFWWSSLDQGVKALVRGGHHCIVTRTVEIMRRPLSHAIHGDRPNQVVHLEFLYMGLWLTNKKYLIILRDDLLSHVWLWLPEFTTTAIAAEAVAFLD